MFIKIRTPYNPFGITYHNTEEEDFGIMSAYHSGENQRENFYYFKLYPRWFSYDILKEEGEFDTSKEVEELVETIINSIIEGVKILDLNALIEKIKSKRLKA